MRRHVNLARRAAVQYQCYDAFARVAMTFGTNQLLHALCFYVLGYVAVQDGAAWPAWCVVILMGCIALSMVHLDYSLTFREASARSHSGVSVSIRAQVKTVFSAFELRKETEDVPFVSSAYLSLTGEEPKGYTRGLLAQPLALSGF